MVASFGALVSQRYSQGHTDGSVAVALVDALAKVRADALREARDHRRRFSEHPPTSERVNRSQRCAKWASLSVSELAESACDRAGIDFISTYRAAWRGRSPLMANRKTRRALRGSSTNNATAVAVANTGATR